MLETWNRPFGAPPLLQPEVHWLFVIVLQILSEVHNAAGLLVGQSNGGVEPQGGKGGCQSFNLGIPLNIVWSDRLLKKKRR